MDDYQAVFDSMIIPVTAGIIIQCYVLLCCAVIIVS